MTTLLLAIAALAALCLAAFCAGAETAFMSVGRGRIVHLAREGSAAAAAVASALKDMNRTLTSLLIGNNLAHVVFSSSAAALGARLCRSSDAGRAVWTVASAFAVLYLSEFLPKLFCSTRPLGRSLALAKPYRAFAAAMAPLTALGLAATSLFVGDAKDDKKEKVTLSELLRILKDRKDGVKLSDFESALISRILVMRRKGRKMTAEALLSVLDEEDV